MLREVRLDAAGALHHVVVRLIEKPRIGDDVNDRLDAYKGKAESVALAGACRLPMVNGT
jgi:hypothetical protein